jgi:uncharacterized delta-60 repeat protein
MPQCIPSIVPPASGALDRTFGACGLRITSAADNTAAAPVHYDATDVVIQPDNKIVVVGRRTSQIGNNHDTLVLRYTAAGALDTSFGTGGVTVVNASGSGFGPESARDALLQADGAIVVVGTSTNETVEGTKGYILRLTSTGALDTGFGGTGVVQIPAMQEATGVIADAGGGFYVTGKKSQPSRTAQLTHVLASGALDAAFGTGGTVAITYAGGEETGDAIAASPGGFAVVGLTAYSIAWGNLGVNRFTPAGALDTAFSADGKITHSLGGKGGVADAVLADDLVLYVGGMRQTGSPAADRFALTRVSAAGAASTTTTSFPSSSEGAINALARNGPRLYAAGYVRKTTAGVPYRMALAAYGLGGALDTTFSGDGMAEYALAGDVRATAVGVQSAGGIILVGRRMQSGASPGAIVLARIVP